MLAKPGKSVSPSGRENLVIQTFQGEYFGGKVRQFTNGIVEFHFPVVSVLFANIIDQRLLNDKGIINDRIQSSGMMQVLNIRSLYGRFFHPRAAVRISFRKMFPRIDRFHGRDHQGKFERFGLGR